MSIIPRFEAGKRRVSEINFSCTVAPGATVTLCSSSIPYPCRVLLAKMIFTPDANNWIRFTWFMATTFQAATVTFPAGESVFAGGTAGGSFRGTAIERVAHSNKEFKDPTNYAVLLVTSTSPYVYEVNCSIIVEEM